MTRDEKELVTAVLERVEQRIADGYIANVMLTDIDPTDHEECRRYKSFDLWVGRALEIMSRVQPAQEAP